LYLSAFAPLLCQRVLGEGWSLMAAAEAAGVSERTTAKWLARYRAEGETGLVDPASPSSSRRHNDAERENRGPARTQPEGGL
jgi:transposase